MKQEYIDIHNAIHNKELNEVEINNEKLPIQKTGSGLRFVDYDDIRWIEQNKSKNSTYAVRARNGEKITWGMRPHNGWILIDKATTVGTMMKQKLEEAHIQ